MLGSIQIRENERNTILDVPNFVKVILSAFLVIPMYYWIVFPIKEVDANTSTSSSSAKTKKKNKPTMDKDESRVQI